MDRLLSTIKGVFALAFFSIAASIATTNFENTVIASLGLIYASLTIGVLSINHRTREATLSVSQLVLLSINIIAGQEHKEGLDEFVNLFDKKADSLINESFVTYSIELIFNILIILGSIYLLYVSFNV